MGRGLGYGFSPVAEGSGGVNRLFLGIVCIDIFALKCVQSARAFLVEWLSWTVRGIERGMIVVYMASGLFGLRQRWISITFSCVLGLLLVFIVFALWTSTYSDDQGRLQKLMDGHWMVLRVFLVGLALHWVTVLIVYRDLPSLGSAVQGVTFLLIHVSTSLPEGGEPGRRRKMALDKVRALFGTAWESAPVGIV